MPYPHSKGLWPPLQKVCMMHISLFSFIFTCKKKTNYHPISLVHDFRLWGRLKLTTI